MTECLLFKRCYRKYFWKAKPPPFQRWTKVKPAVHVWWSHTLVISLPTLDRWWRTRRDTVSTPIPIALHPLLLSTDQCPQVPLQLTTALGHTYSQQREEKGAGVSGKASVCMCVATYTHMCTHICIYTRHPRLPIWNVDMMVATEADILQIYQKLLALISLSCETNVSNRLKGSTVLDVSRGSFPIIFW